MIDQGSDTCGKMERPDVGGQVVLKFLLNLTHPLDQIFSVFRQAHGGRGGDQALSAAHEQFSVELVGEVVQLKTGRAGERKTFSAARVMLGDSITARNSSSW